MLVFLAAGYSHAQGPNLTSDVPPKAAQASPWNHFLGDAMQSGLSAAHSGAMVPQSGPRWGIGGGPKDPGAGISVNYFKLISDLGAGLAAGHNNAFGATMHSLPKLSEWLRSGITVPLGSQTHGPSGAAEAGLDAPHGGPGGSGGPTGWRGGEHASAGGFHLGYQNSLLGAGGSGGAGFSGLNVGSASASYEAPRSAGNRFGFSASATAGADAGSGGATSFGGGGAAAGLGMGSSKGSMFATSGGGSAMSSGSMGGVHSSPVQGIGPGSGGHGGSKVGAAVNLKLTF